MKEFILQNIWWVIIFMFSVLVTWRLDINGKRYYRNVKKLLWTRAPSLLSRIWGLREILTYEGEKTEGKLREIQLKIKQRIEDIAAIQGEFSGKVCGEPVVAKLSYPNKLHIKVQTSEAKMAIQKAYRVMMKKHARDKVILYPLELDIKTL